jgi:hypothetical protein
MKINLPSECKKTKPIKANLLASGRKYETNRRIFNLFIPIAGEIQYKGRL